MNQCLELLQKGLFPRSLQKQAVTASYQFILTKSGNHENPCSKTINITLPYASRHFWTPPNLHLPPGHPPRTAPGQVIALGDQTLVNRTGEQGDAVPSHLVAEVLTGHADA